MVVDLLLRLSMMCTMRCFGDGCQDMRGSRLYAHWPELRSLPEWRCQHACSRPSCASCTTPGIQGRISGPWPSAPCVLHRARRGRSRPCPGPAAAGKHCALPREHPAQCLHCSLAVLGDHLQLLKLECAQALRRLGAREDPRQALLGAAGRTRRCDGAGWEGGLWAMAAVLLARQAAPHLLGREGLVLGKAPPFVRGCQRRLFPSGAFAARVAPHLLCREEMIFRPVGFQLTRLVQESSDIGRTPQIPLQACIAGLRSSC
mmetsp:Transcript_20744/g.58351  ORF Transcript_20744/g.58351 Transcript_20744/m.58351 type:complete len:260 (-) Transcript_20744:612-1391(-)